VREDETMSVICPKTFKVCCDDICNSGSCLGLGGMPTLEKCDHCGHLFSRDGDIECDCPPDCPEWYEEEQWQSDE
jgi:hypothetical protein